MRLPILPPSVSSLVAVLLVAAARPGAGQVAAPAQDEATVVLFAVEGPPEVTATVEALLKEHWPAHHGVRQNALRCICPQDMRRLAVRDEL